MAKIVFTIIVLVLTLQVNAQIITSWGIKTGLTSTGYSEWDPADSSLKKLFTTKPTRRALFSIGMFAEGLTTKYLSTVLEMSYNPKSVSFSYPTRNGSGEVTGEEYIDNRIGYLSVMLCQKARIGWNKTNLYVFAGPRLDLQINENVDIDFSPTYKKFDATIFGLSAGGGLQFVGRKVTAFFEFQYEPDLSYTINNSYGKVKKNTWLARIGVSFNAKK
ncbi:MAG: outer membrane beta-barrel protein [Ignavibacteria bacterium]|nr:outer membrane beta-barrel protein [Ignavibacteria bacterium]